jgi:hypothetical protein
MCNIYHVMETQLSKLHHNMVAKLFFAAVAGWLVGRNVNTNVRGTPAEIDAVANVMLASKRFQDEMQKPDATVDGIMQQLHIKHIFAREFELVFGIPWPL